MIEIRLMSLPRPDIQGSYHGQRRSGKLWRKNFEMVFFTHGILKRIYEYFISTRQAQTLLELRREGSNAFFVRDNCCCYRCLLQRRFYAKRMGIVWSVCATD